MRKNLALVFLGLVSHLSFLSAQVREEWVTRSRAATTANAIAVDAPGNVYVAGFSGGAWVTTQYDPRGNEIWVSRYRGIDDPHMVVDAEGNVYLTGRSPGMGTGSGYATVKYDTGGNLVWEAIHSGGVSNAIAVDAEQNVYVTGSSCIRVDEFRGDCLEAESATIKYAQE